MGSVSSQASVASCRILGEHDNLEKTKDLVMESAPSSPPSASHNCGDIHNDLTSVTTLAQTSAGDPNQKNNLVGDRTDQGNLRHQGEVVS